jgi:hypothetical protein
LASVADVVSCHLAIPNRRCSSSATQAASSLGSIVVDRSTAAASPLPPCPVIAPVSPRQKSTYSMPSTSTNRAPSAVGDVHRERSGPPRHPRHRHTGEQVPAAGLGEFGRAWMPLDELPELSPPSFGESHSRSISLRGATG